MRLRAPKRFVVPYVMLLTATSALRAGMAVTAGQAVTRVGRGDLAPSVILIPATLAMLVPVLVYLSAIQAGWLMTTLSAQLRVEAFDNIIHRPYSFFLRADRGQLNSRLLYDVMEVLSAYLQSLNTFVVAGTAGGFAVAAMVTFNPVMAIPLLLSALACVGGAVLWTPRLRSRAAEVSDASGKLTSTMFIAVGRTTALESIIYGERNRIQRRFASAIQNHAQAQRHRILTASRGALSIDIMGGMALAGTLGLGLFLLQRDAVGVGEVTTAALLVLTAMGPLAAMSQRLMQTTGARVNLARLKTLAPLGGSGHPEHARGAPRLCSTDKEAVLRLADVSYDYRFDNPPMPADLRIRTPTEDVSADSNESCVEGINLTIRSAERVGLTGDSGSGKSTLALLAVGAIEPQKGHVVRSGRTPGVLLVTAEPSDHLGTLREFLDPHNGVDDDEVWSVLADVGMWDQVRSKEDPLTSDFNPQQGDISTGQMRRMMMAKALLANPDVVILDEALSHVEVSLAIRILDAFRQRYIAVLLVTHNRHHLSQCDRVAHLGRGQALYA